MPGTQSLIGGGEVPGLTLRAWALFNTSGGGLIKGLGVSSVNRNAQGNYTVNFSPALPDVNYLPVARAVGANGQTVPLHMTQAVAGTVNACTVFIQSGSTGFDSSQPVWVGFYG